LPGGGKPWFVRVRSRTRYKINPCSPEGWWVVIGYCLFVGIVPGLALLTGRQPPSVPRWITFAILLVASTAVFIAVLFRMSLPAENKEKGK
jgi:hypothetical protein